MDSAELVPRGATVAIANQKGGQGKSTTAVTAGAELARRGWQVRLIDADPQDGSASHWLPPQWHDAAAGARADLSHVLLGETGLSQATWPTTVPGLDLVPSYATAAQFERAGIAGADVVLRDELQAGPKTNYDLTLIDCAPSLGQLTVTALVAATAVLVPVKAGGLDLAGVGELNRTLSVIRRRLNPDLRVAAVVVCDRLGSNLSDDVAVRLADDWPEALHASIRHTVRVSEAPLSHEPLTTYAPASTAMVDYGALIDTLFPATRRTTGTVAGQQEGEPQ